MTTHNFSIEYLAKSLVVRLDRKNIFPPSYNNPEIFVPSVGSSKNSTKLSSVRPRKPPNAFLICRKNVQEESKRKGTFNMRVISKVTSILWKNATFEEKEVYKRLVESVCEIYYKRNSMIYKKTSSKKKSLSRKSNSTTLSEGPVVTPPPPFLSPPSSFSSPSPSPSLSPPLSTCLIAPSNSNFNFNLADNDFLLNNNNNIIDFNSYTDFNCQIIPQNYHEQNQFLTYNNILLTPQNFINFS
jgi:hypothetical protein